MKKYVIFMTDLAAPLQGKNPRGGRIVNLDKIDEAQSLAEDEKMNWDLVSIFKRIKEGELEKIEQYQKGRKYNI